MNRDVKNIIRATAPPIILNAAKSGYLLIRKSYSSQKQVGEKRFEWYDDSYEKSDHYRCHYSLSPYYFLWTVISDRIARAGVDSIFEIGCGTGQLACLLRDNGITRYHGFDFSPKRIAHAKRTCPKFTFSLQDAFQTDLYTAYSYDAVICTEFLEHVERDVEILNRLRSGALFYGTVPNFPYISHVRHFKSKHEVFRRYGKFFESLQVDSFLANNRGTAFYILEGRIK